LLHSIVIPVRPTPEPLILHVSPQGSDRGDGSAAHPFKTLQRVQEAVRRHNADRSVTVELADGVYRLSEPLRFAAEDGGRDGYVVSWQAAEGAHPVISGGIPVTGWRLAIWLNLNSQDVALPNRTAMDNTAIGNWHKGGRINGSWTDYLNNRLVDNVAVEGEWPERARTVIERSGVQPEDSRNQ
jgi:hypothetical protein